MASIEQLRELAERLEKATGADKEIDARLFCFVEGLTFEAVYKTCIAFTPHGVTNGLLPHQEPYTSSIDAALALVERMLPKREILMGIDAEGGFCMITPGQTYLRRSHTLALAILSAFVDALIAQAEAA